MVASLLRGGQPAVPRLATAAAVAIAHPPMEIPTQRVGRQQATRDGPTTLAAAAITGAVIEVPARGPAAVPSRCKAAPTGGPMGRAASATPKAAPTDAVDGAGRLIATTLT